MKAIKYVGGSNTDQTTYQTLTSGSRWANASTKDGSMWVWIPRFAYRITNGYHQSGSDINPTNGWLGSGTIEIAFLKDNTNQFLDSNITGTVITSGVTDSTYNDSSKWILEPAFTLGNEQLSGFWFAKFNASELDGSAGSSNLILEIKPNKQAKVLLSASNMFATCQNLKSNSNFGIYFNNVNNVDTHLTKNVEWGAMVYLTHSKYGINRERITDNHSKTTGMGADYSLNYARNDKYNTITGITASTTNNVYGVYDLNGYVQDVVAACYTGYKSHITSNNDATFINKYIDIYSDYSISKYGDAIYETSSSATGEDTTWFDSRSDVSARTNGHLIRGGSGSYSYMFAFYWSGDGGGSAQGFRPICVVK